MNRITKFDYLKYTYLHRKAFKLLVKKLNLTSEEKVEMLNRAKYHDIDKLSMYLAMDIKDAHNYHVTHQPHHVNNNLEKNFYDYLEMAIDWECAAITKPDKPLNAYDTLYKYYPEMEKYILPILKKFNLDYSYEINIIPPEYSEEINENYNIDKITEEDILNEIKLLFEKI